jgi:hypothetical protein
MDSYPKAKAYNNSMANDKVFLDIFLSSEKLIFT